MNNHGVVNVTVLSLKHIYPLIVAHLTSSIHSGSIQYLLSNLGGHFWPPRRAGWRMGLERSWTWSAPQVAPQLDQSPQAPNLQLEAAYKNVENITKKNKENWLFRNSVMNVKLINILWLEYYNG